MLKEIKNRRSIRSYKNEDISIDIIKDILKSGLMAPSAKNNQPWRFLIVSQDVKTKISSKMIELVGPNKTAEVIANVPYLILVYNSSDEYFNHLSIGAAIENILLECENRNLGSLWIGYIKKIEDYVKELVGVEMELVSAIAIGVKDENPLPRTRLNLEDILISSNR